MMSPGEFFKKAATLQKLGTWLFWISSTLTVSLLFARNTKFELWLSIPLVSLAGITLFISLRSRILVNDGNAKLREAQLADALAASCEYPAKEGYYNSLLPSGMRRLFATTCESSGLTAEILNEMLCRQTRKLAGFILVFLIYLGYAKADASILAVTAQIVFSGDLIATTVNLYRYQRKSRQVHQTFLHIFRTRADTEDAEALAVSLTAYADYECAKEESAILLSRKIFDEKNPDYSIRWEKIRKDFKIDHAVCDNL